MNTGAHPKDYFSGHATEYAKFRPVYPEALFKFLSKQLKRRGVAWDCACGNGQIAIALTEYFPLVCATDISETQIRAAPAHKGILYSVLQAEQTDFPNHFFDCITIGQAIHWFDHDLFYQEVDRVLNPNGIIAAIGYGLLRINPEVDIIIDKLYSCIVGKHWPDERKYIDDGYQSLPFPFEPVETPAFAMQQVWTLDQLKGYLNTWSAVKLYEQEQMSNPVMMIEEDLNHAWGKAETHIVNFELMVKVGRKASTATS